MRLPLGGKLLGEGSFFCPLDEGVPTYENPPHCVQEQALKIVMRLSKACSSTGNPADWHTKVNDDVVSTHKFNGSGNINQDVDESVKQMTGSDNAFENREQAFRSGYAAQRHDHSDHPTRSDDVDAKLRADYQGDYDNDRRYIQHAYRYKYAR